MDNLRILVVEDSAPNRMILKKILEKLGFVVDEADSGQTALEVINEAEEKFDCIFSDIMMPNMNGIELLQNLRDIEEYKNTHYVLVTAVADKDYIIEARKYHASGYILKPIQTEMVRAKIKELFPNWKPPL